MSNALSQLFASQPTMRIKHQFERKLSSDRTTAVVNIIASAQAQDDIATAVGYHIGELVAMGFMPKSSEPTYLAASNSNQVTFTSKDPNVIARFVADNVELLPDNRANRAAAPSAQ